MKNQMNQLNQQQNRFLESPFVIRDTSPEGQIAFGTADNFTGGIVFKKESFSMSSVGAEQLLENEAEDNSETDGDSEE